MTSPPRTELEPIATAIGWVAIEAARVEILAAYLETLLIGHERASVVTTGQNWATVRQGIEALAIERTREAMGAPAEDRAVDPPTYAGMVTTVRKADALMAKRSQVVHALWSSPDEAGAHEWVVYKRFMKRHRGTWTLPDLAQLRQELLEVVDEFGGAIVALTRDARNRTDTGQAGRPSLT